jgi:glutamine amidotransferase
MKVVIVDYNAGNIRSLCYALEKIGVDWILSSDALEIEQADRVIIPGVGAAGAALQQLRSKSLDLLIPQLKQPVLGICLGMQLLCAHSEEDDTACLGIIPQSVLKFKPAAGLKVPHMGWNQVHKNVEPDKRWMYFVHSYYVPVNEFTTLQCNHGTPFSAMVQKDNFTGMQFHPEKSAREGMALLEQFLKS